MNVITIAGTIGRDMEIRHLNNGDPVGNFSVADSQGRDKPTTWWRCQLYGKRAESLQQYMLKGQQVTVSGSVVERKWTKDGVEQTAMEVRVNEVALQGGPRQAAQPAAPAPAPRQRQGGGFEDMDDSIPFRDPLSYRGAHLVL